MRNIQYYFFSRILNNQKGVSAILIAIVLPVLLGFAALAIDVGYMYVTKNELQNIADASALAGASELGRIYLELPKTEHYGYAPDEEDEERIKDAAKLVALENDAAGISIELLDSDIHIGHWDFNETDSEMRFKDNETLPTKLSPAVRVVARRDSILNNPVGTFFANIFGSGFNTFDSRARATAALSGIPSIAEGVMNTPFAISQNHPCDTFIEFNPTPSSCAGWHVYFDSPANANALSNKMYGFIKDHTDGTAWLSSHAGNVPNNLTAQTPPEVSVGNSLSFTGGNLASLFNGFYYSDWDGENTPDIDSEAGQGNSYAPFFALFDFFKFRDDDNDGDGTPIDVCGTDYHPDEVWSTFVPVYQEGTGGCINPNQTIDVVSFAYIQIIQPYQPPNKNIEVCVRCTAIDEDLGRGAGGTAGFIIGSISNLVE